jgi:hypothetical protein
MSVNDVNEFVKDRLLLLLDEGPGSSNGTEALLSSCPIVATMFFSIPYSVRLGQLRFRLRTIPILTLPQILLILSAILSYFSRYSGKVVQKSSSYFGNFGSAFGTASNGANRPAPYPSELAALSQILLLRITNRITGNMPTFTLDVSGASSSTFPC